MPKTCVAYLLIGGTGILLVAALLAMRWADFDAPEARPVGAAATLEEGRREAGSIPPSGFDPDTLRVRGTVADVNASASRRTILLQLPNGRSATAKLAAGAPLQVAPGTQAIFRCQSVRVLKLPNPHIDLGGCRQEAAAAR